MRKAMSSVVFGAVLVYACAAGARAADSVDPLGSGPLGGEAQTNIQRADSVAAARMGDARSLAGDARSLAGDDRRSAAAPLGPPASRRTDSHYRYQNGRWWYRSPDKQWLLWNGTRWLPYRSRAGIRANAAAVRQGAGAVQRGAAEGGAAAARGGAATSSVGAAGFDAWFDTYRGFSTGRARLGTAEGGQVEMATSDITAAGEVTEGFEMGALPRSQARRRRPGVGRSLSGSGSWFNSGSPFGIRYGYGSGFGYGGYGFDSPYGYGSRTGSGGAYAYSFGPFGAVGGQTGERLSSLMSGPMEEGGRLIGPEPAGIGAPSRLKSPVGGSYGKAGSGARQLGGSATESSD